MAFTAAQQVQIRKYLGYPQVFRYRNSRLEDAITVVGADVDSSAEVVSILASIAGVETGLTSALENAGLKRAEDIEWYQSSASGSSEVDTKRAEGRRFCARLSQLFGVPLLNDAFGTAGYEDDGFMGVGHQYGGPIPMG